jgi:DNA-binding NarL/FixJ family response regulator
MKKKILVVEDQVIVQMGLEILLDESFHSYQIEMVASFSDAVDYLKKEEVSLIILDINIPGSENSKMIEKFRFIQPFVKILVFTGLQQEIYAEYYLNAGANGFVSKIDDEKQLLLSVNRILSQENHSQSVKIENTAAKDFFSELSGREQQVMDLLIQGRPTGEIATALNLKVSTVSTYKSRIFEKLNVENLIELIKIVDIYKNLN